MCLHILLPSVMCLSYFLILTIDFKSGNTKPCHSPCGHQVAMKHPSAVTACNLDLENLITDSNRSIATLAITTLLKTGSESSVDRLMKQISSFVSEISDEFKVSQTDYWITI